MDKQSMLLEDAALEMKWKIRENRKIMEG